MSRLIAFALFVCALPVFAGEVFKDDYSAPKLPERKAARGDWKFTNGTASCTQDDALFKKNKDHGPIIFYDLPHQDAKVSFSFKADGSKTLVFTANGEKGHVFRFVMSSAGTSVRYFGGGESEKSGELTKGPALKLGEWVDVSVELKGPKATIAIGKDYKQTVEHASYATVKTNLSIGFSYGTLSLKGWSVEK